MSQPKSHYQILLISESKYQLFWESNNASIFLNSHWINTVKNMDEHVAYYGLYDNSTLLNAFPVVLRNGRIFKTVTLPKLTPFLGWILPGDNLIIKSFIQNLNTSAASYSFINYSFSLNKLVTHQIDLMQSEAVLLSNLRQDKKRNIKKAQQQNLRITIESNFEILENLLKITFARQKHPFNGYSQVQKIVENYPYHFQVNIYNQQQCLASLLIVYDRSTAYYLIGGFDNSLDNYNAGPFAMWTAILESKKKNLNIFDFEGSSVPSIAQYFKSFGAQEVAYSNFESKKWYLRLIEKIKR